VLAGLMSQRSQVQILPSGAATIYYGGGNVGRHSNRATDFGLVFQHSPRAVRGFSDRMCSRAGGRLVPHLKSPRFARFMYFVPSPCVRNATL
jgi:hypothetical protein